MRPASATHHLAPEDNLHGAAIAAAAENELERPRTEIDLCSLDPSDPHGGGGDNFVKLTVHLTPEAFDCLADASEVTGDTRTDVVNRALKMYAAIQNAAARGGGDITFRSRRGQKHRAVIV